MSVAQPAPGSVVVGVDGSESSLKALRWAAFVASATGSTLVVASAYQPAPTFGLVGSGRRSAAERDPDAVSREALEALVHRVLGGPSPAGLECRVLRGNAAELLLDLSAHARMLVLGSRRHGRVRRLLPGSVSAACTEQATCRVLVVDGTTPPPPHHRA